MLFTPLLTLMSYCLFFELPLLFYFHIFICSFFAILPCHASGILLLMPYAVYFDAADARYFAMISTLAYAAMLD